MLYHSERQEERLKEIADEVEVAAKKAEEFKPLVYEILEMLNVFPEVVKQETIANLTKIFGNILSSFD